MEYSHELLCLVVGVHVITISGILARAHRYAYKHIKSSHAIWRCVERAITYKINLNIFFLVVARYHFCSSIFFLHYVNTPYFLFFFTEIRKIFFVQSLLFLDFCNCCWFGFLFSSAWIIDFHLKKKNSFNLTVMLTLSYESLSKKVSWIANSIRCFACNLVINNSFQRVYIAVDSHTNDTYKFNLIFTIHSAQISYSNSFQNDLSVRCVTRIVYLLFLTFFKSNSAILFRFEIKKEFNYAIICRPFS